MIFDKIGIMNDALIATGNEPVTVEDGSPQWIAASTAYERALPLVLSKHNWPFGTTTIALGRLGASAYPGFLDIYAKPVDCLHLENVWRTDLVFPGQVFDEETYPPALNYKVIGDQIHCTAPLGATALYLVNPGSATNWSPGFAEALRREIESLLYQGLNDEADEAKITKALARAELAEARAKVDSESPSRVAFRSSMLERRRTRLNGWGW